MSGFATTKMSSKGQVVIPEEIRRRLGLKAGSKFIVVGDKDTLILKAITASSIDELIAEARKKARIAGMKHSDIEAAIAEARGQK